jgi:DNA-binding cell septation regulator SpoVG
MKITIEHHNDQFNVALTSPTGDEPFITIKGCRVVQGGNGPFVSFPAKKLDSGKYWNHVYASRAFSDAVLREYNKSKARAPAPSRRPPPPAPMDDEPPF